MRDGETSEVLLIGVVREGASRGVVADLTARVCCVKIVSTGERGGHREEDCGHVARMDLARISAVGL